MTGAEALVYARSRHRAIGGDFDRGRRQQRVLVSLRDQMNVQSLMANFDSLAKTLSQSVKTDIPLGEMPKLLSLADSVDTKNIRSYVFAPPFYGSDTTLPVRGYIIEPNITRIRRAVKDAFSTPASLLAQRDRLGAEEARVWVLNGSGRSGLSTTTADAWPTTASRPRPRTSGRHAAGATTKIVVYNGAESEIPETIEYLEDLFKRRSRPRPTRRSTVDIIVTLGATRPTCRSTRSADAGRRPGPRRARAGRRDG